MKTRRFNGWLMAVLLAGATCARAGTNGVLQANGGNGPAWGADGSGGRIAVEYSPSAQSNASLPSVQFSVLPYAMGGTVFGGTRAADIGTVHFPDAGVLTEPINVSGQILLGTLSWAPNRLTVSNNWVRFPQEGFRLTVMTDVTIMKGSSVGILEIGGSVLTNFNFPNPVSANSLNAYRFFAVTSPPVLNVGGNLILTNSASLCMYSAMTNGIAPEYGSLVNVGSNMVIGTGCWVYAYSHWSNGASSLFKMRSLTISSNGGFNANGLGFASATNSGGRGFGPGGGGQGSPSYTRQGGSYGGLGGLVTDTGKTYGSSNAPTLPGSGGGTSGNQGGFGGGLLWISASNQVTLDGTITANGGVGSYDHEGGGSGGGVYLRCKNFMGSTNGIIRANGGDGYTDGGSGGGGRIAIWRQTDKSSGTISNSAAGSTKTPAGSNGTVVWGWLPVPGTVVKFR